MRDGNERLLDMLEAIEEIERYAVRGREAVVALLSATTDTEDTG